MQISQVYVLLIIVSVIDLVSRLGIVNDHLNTLHWIIFEITSLLGRRILGNQQSAKRIASKCTRISKIKTHEGLADGNGITFDDIKRSVSMASLLGALSPKVFDIRPSPQHHF